MTLVDAETGEVVEPTPFTENEASEWADAVQANWSELTERIIEGYRRRAWLGLGYGSWNEMCAQLGLPRIEDRDQRRELVADLRRSGMGPDSIGAALGASSGTVRNDLAGSQDCDPGYTLGEDGKQYPSRKQAQPEVEEINGETVLHDPESGESTVIGDPDLTPTPDYEPDPKPPITKPDLGGGISHPARFSDAILERFAKVLDRPQAVLDPFAGTGRIHELQAHGHITTGIEIEPEYAAMHADTREGSALELPFVDCTFDAIATSPTYGNRLADKHNASDPELRRSYTHDLGRTLHTDNSGGMQWGVLYREFHLDAWREAVRVLEPGGLFLLNIKDHIRGGEQQAVTAWHVYALTLMGLHLDPDLSGGVATSHLRQGSTTERAGQELVLVFLKAAD